jgi:glycosyltransferase involved in cell wall biosynthesis
MGGPFRIGVVGTYPPRACGLATFTADVAASLRTADNDVLVTALVDGPNDHAPGAAHRLVQSSHESARLVATAMSVEVDAVLIEHEFGIFGGTGSASVLQAFTDGLTVPYVITLHTVVVTFSAGQRHALAEPLARAALVFVFSEQAAELVAAQFPATRSRCRVVPHAAPVEMYRRRTTALRRQVGLPEDAKVITTFGLLSPSKGIENAIRALPATRAAAGPVRYVVAGQTHPEVARRHGEAYRDGLIALCVELGVADIVEFRDWFHDVGELSALLRTSDVFVTPYLDPEQIVSGALSFAVAAGLAFVSTRYRYAVELAAQGCGLTVDFHDPDGLAAALTQMVTDDRLRERAAHQSELVAATRSWPEVGRRMSDLCQSVADERWPERGHRVVSLCSDVVGLDQRVAMQWQGAG